ncbi:MAG: PDZ domain-containing protein [Clostridia bacterium]|nr:PDZ domain-containing protein [Clostridia bacterium]
MDKKISVKWLVAIVCLFTVAAICITTMFFCFFVVPKREGTLYWHNQKLLEIKELVDNYYIGEISDQMISDGIASGYVYGLNDAYSGYVTANDAEANLDALLGYNTGIGVQVSAHPDNNTIYVLDVHKDSPAQKGGIKSSDEIVKLDGQGVAEMGYSAAVNYIKSRPLGNILKVTVNRKGELMDFSVELTTFLSQSVFYKMIGDKAYIQITSFNEASVDQFVEAVDAAEKDNAKGIIFDLRGNGGGTLTSVYHILDYLIPEGLAIEVKYKNEADCQTYLSDANDVDLPMVVLTDENTASASELFTQGLKDYEKAVSIGRKTFGKGVVQRTFTLSDGSLVKFTVAKYYTANGTCLDGIGVEPDYPVEWTEDELRYRLINGIEADKDFIKACAYLDGQLS